MVKLRSYHSGETPSYLMLALADPRIKHSQNFSVPFWLVATSSMWLLNTGNLTSWIEELAAKVILFLLNVNAHMHF